MQYAEFYHNSNGYVEGSKPPRFDDAHVKLIPACGSDSVMRCDGRWSLSRCASEARAHMAKLNSGLRKGYRGFTINTGRSYTDSRTIRALETLEG